MRRGRSGVSTLTPLRLEYFFPSTERVCRLKWCWLWWCTKTGANTSSDGNSCNSSMAHSWGSYVSQNSTRSGGREGCIQAHTVGARIFGCVDTNNRSVGVESGIPWCRAREPETSTIHTVCGLFLMSSFYSTACKEALIGDGDSRNIRY